MGAQKMIYVLDDGQRLTVEDVMKKAKIKLTAARWRLKESRDPEKVLAKKGRHVDQGYSKSKKNPKKLNKALQHAAKIYKKEKKVKADQIRKNHPFYDKGKEGELHRLLWGKWQKD